jgi:hypothetical protein
MLLAEGVPGRGFDFHQVSPQPLGVSDDRRWKPDRTLSLDEFAARCEVADTIQKAAGVVVHLTFDHPDGKTTWETWGSQEDHYKLVSYSESD